MSIVGETARIDIGVTQSLAAYLAFGIDPGSFGMALLRGDAQAAYDSAHEMLMPKDEHEVLGIHGSEDIVATMLEVVQSSIPVFARGDDINRWMKHKGLSGAPESIKTMTKLSVENPVIWNYVVKNHPDVVTDRKPAAA